MSRRPLPAAAPTAPLITPRARTATRRAASIANLPQIDMIVVSHNHYDSLDVTTLKAIAHRDRITVVAPPGP